MAKDMAYPSKYIHKDGRTLYAWGVETKQSGPARALLSRLIWNYLQGGELVMGGTLKAYPTQLDAAKALATAHKLIRG